MQLAEIKRAMVLGTIVKYGDMPYRITGCTLKYDAKNAVWYYLLELQDLKANSVMIVPMQYVDVLRSVQNSSEIGCTAL